MCSTLSQKRHGQSRRHLRGQHRNVRTRGTSPISACAPCGRTTWRSSIATSSSSRPPTGTTGDRNHYLTDGHVTLVIMPWEITDYDGTGIISAGMDHIGFKVESVEALKQEVEQLAADNPRLAPAPIVRSRRLRAGTAVPPLVSIGPAPDGGLRRHADRCHRGLASKTGKASTRRHAARSSRPILLGFASGRMRAWADPVAEFYRAAR